MKIKLIAFLLGLVLLVGQSALVSAKTIDEQTARDALILKEAETDDSSSDPVALYEAGDYERALQVFLELANNGDVTAMSWAGYMYDQGAGTPRDTASAINWFEQAAQQGDGYSMCYLARLFQKEENNEESIFWAGKARDIGYIDAEVCEMVGLMYFFGNGVETDYKEAEAWLELAADLDSLEAIHRLGEIYQLYSENVPGHEQIAMEWYERGAELGDAACKYHLADYLQRDPNATLGMLTRSYELFHEAIDAGNENAMIRYGTILLQGFMGKTERPEEAKKEAQEIFARLEASSSATPERLASIGDAWKNALPEVADLEEAARCYQKAAKQGNTYAMERLAQLAIDRKDFEEAYSFLIEAEQTGNESVYVFDWLGWLYASGYVDGKPDYDLAAQYYERAVELGDGYALYQIGIMYQKGQHYEASEEKAQEYYRLAEEAGYTEE